MPHWSGIRSGFNTPGGTDKENLRVAIAFQTEYCNPESWYWQYQARSAMNNFGEALHKPNLLWTPLWDLVNAKINSLTWHDISNIYKTFLEKYRENPGISAEALAHEAGILPE